MEDSNSPPKILHIILVMRSHQLFLVGWLSDLFLGHIKLTDNIKEPSYMM